MYSRRADVFGRIPERSAEVVGMARRYRFNDIEIDLEGFRLLKGGHQLPVEPKALNLLIFLVDNRGKLERQKLIRAVLARRLCYRSRAEPRRWAVAQTAGG